MGKRLRQLRMLPLIAASLVMVLASVPALAEQATDVVPADPATPPGQDDPASESPRGAPGVCDHAAGEFLVGYTSEEALRTAPPDNVVDTFGGILAQHLAFEEIMNIPDPAERLVTEEAKRQELEARPGVAYAEYNCVATAQAASAERAADLPTPASCGDCGRYVVDRAKEVIADGFGDAEGRDAFDAALEAARSTGTDDENVAFASEIELDEASADGGSDGNSESSSADGDSASEGNDADDSASDDAVSGGSGAGGAGGKAADDDESGAEEEADGEESSSGDTEDETEGEDNASAGPEPVAGKNVAATTSVPREAGGTGGKVMALGAGALLLAAGAMARRTFWS